MRPMTKNGRDFYEVSSLQQKSLRRGDLIMSARAASELLPKYASYVWNRLMVVSAEDCGDLVTGEVVALYDAWSKVRPAPSASKPLKGYIFFFKALVILARCRHSRDADEVLLLVTERLPDAEFDDAVQQCARISALGRNPTTSSARRLVLG